MRKDSRFADRVAGRIGYHCGANDGSGGVSTPKILLVDDDVDLLELLKTYLEREEFAATAINVAATGVAAALRCRDSHNFARLRIALTQRISARSLS